MATHGTEDLPGISTWDIARSLGRLESHAEQSSARADRGDARMDRLEARMDRLFITLIGIGAAIMAGVITGLVKMFAG